MTCRTGQDGLVVLAIPGVLVLVVAVVVVIGRCREPPSTGTVTTTSAICRLRRRSISRPPAPGSRPGAAGYLRVLASSTILNVRPVVLRSGRACNLVARATVHPGGFRPRATSCTPYLLRPAGSGQAGDRTPWSGWPDRAVVTRRWHSAARQPSTRGRAGPPAAAAAGWTGAFPGCAGSSRASPA